MSQGFSGLDHCVGAVRYDDVCAVIGLYGIEDKLSVVIGEVEAVFFKDCPAVVVEVDSRLGKNFVDHGFAYFVFAFLVEVDFIYGASYSEELDFHVCWSRVLGVRYWVLVVLHLSTN